MSKTLLAVDDSATIRKALEITFGGEDYRVLSADSRASALAQLSQGPDLVLIDTVLGGDDGYALAKEVRSQAPQAAIVLLSSRFNPYDSSRGHEAGADDYCDKPFDTQQLLDKARTVLDAKDARPMRPSAHPYREAPTTATPPSSSQQGPALRAQTLVFGAKQTPSAGESTRPQPPTIVRREITPSPATVSAEHSRPATQVSMPIPERAEPAPPPAESPAANTTTATAAPAAPVAAAAVAQMSPALAQLGLSQEQADAVLALSREVVERVVWEVVPQLAEVLIREEITRLTKE